MKKKGFVVSAILYPLLVLFLALIMGMLSMTDTRKRILDRMKLEIEDSIFDDETCSCDTILNKLNYLIKNGVGGGGASGSYTFNMLTLRVKGYPSVSAFPNRDNAIGDIAIVTEIEIPDYFVSQTPPNEPKEGSIWIVQDIDSPYYIESDYSRIGINYAMQYVHGEWCLVKTYVFMDNSWTLLYYVTLDGTHVNLSGTDINAETSWTYNYTGSYQTFHARFSGVYEVQLWGANGAAANYAGGNGSYTKGEIYLNAGDILYVYVGGSGSGTTGGFNGGANGSGNGRGGGGATDLRLVSNLKDTSKTEFESLKSRIMVAAGGGGANGYTYPSDTSYYSRFYGGAGGALEGYRGYVGAQNKWDYSIYYGVGGTQSRPGYYSVGNGTADGKFGMGGSNVAGGGGGYYGGGGSASYGGAGGGSSYISGQYGCSSISEESTPTDIIHTGSAFHESGYYFVNTKMVDGQGYEWNPDKSSQNGKMPTTNGSSTMNGNAAAGYAKIKMLTVEVKDIQQRKDYQEEKNIDFYYTYMGTDSNHGNYQTFKAPKNGYYKVELWGAQGGSKNLSHLGGLGAYTAGSIYLNKDEKLYLFLGSYTYHQTSGGWNGGGKGSDTGVGGGGGSDVRLKPTSILYDDFESLKTRIMVAGGGGGSNGYTYPSDTSYYSYGRGGAGGGLSGYAGYISSQNKWNYSSNQGLGATQVVGGYHMSSNTSYVGVFGIGATAVSGGGGGYYGGGGGNNYGGAAGSGSSYISGHVGSSSIEESSLEDDIIHNGSITHYSGKYFINTKMVDGTGYEWDSAKITTAVANQPTLGGVNAQTGNSGDGKARIHLISSETKTETQIKDTEIALLNDWYYPNIAVSANTSASRYQVFNVPKNGYYQINMCGAKGASGNQAGGNGACTSGKIYLNAGETFYMYVGGMGYGTSGGWNGGGNGSGTGRGGGGATDMRLVTADTTTNTRDFESLKTRIMVAAGGGGANGYTYPSDTSYYSHATGGYGGALEGVRGSTTSQNKWNYSAYYGTGATQSRPGYYSYSNETADGGFGYGGSNTAGGGGGYYGGGGSSSYGGAGGGSSYISGHTGCSSIENHSSATTVLHNGSPYHYNGYYFLNTSMSANANGGNGYVRIKFMSAETKTKDELDTYRINHNLNFNFSYAGSNSSVGTYQTFTVPKTGNYYIELWGAQGGDYNPSYVGGYGGYTKGKIYLVKGTKLYLYIGAYASQHITPSWNGGGTASGNGRAGGGSVDIRTVPTTTYTVWDDDNSLRSRIMVAGSGGGADGNLYDSDTSYYSYSRGGAGGGLIGYNGYVQTQNKWNYSAYYGTGGSQVAGGKYSSNANLVGTFGKGDSQYAGGGGGWFGGGSSAAYGAGGGGSSYISGHRGCVGVDIDGNLNSSAYTTYSDSVSYTNYEFSETEIIDGTGYRWDTAKITNEVFNMPTHDGSSRMTGNTGDGHAKITYIGA